MDNKKLVIVDIDGTLINSPEQKIPSSQVVDLIKQLNDKVLVTCATGRSYSWALPVLKAAKFTAPPILGGGTYILNSYDLSVMYKFELPQNKLEDLKKILTHYPNVKVLFNDYTEEDYLKGGWRLQTLLEAQKCWMMEVVGLEPKTGDELIKIFRQIDGVTSVKMNSIIPGMVDIHVVHERATKEHAIQLLQKELGISKANTIGVGDGYNDFHIFNAVGTKIAVENAVEELKELADEVIESVEQDPVAKLLGKYI